MSAYIMGKILDWLQRLIVLYSLGEDELPKEYRILLNRYRRENLHEVDKCILYNYSDINHVIEYYEMTIPAQDDSNSFSFIKSQSISVRFIIIDERNIVHVSSRNNITSIIISEDILRVTNLDKYVADRISDLCYMLCFRLNGIALPEIDIDELFSKIISYYFIKSVFKVDWSTIVKYDPHDVIAKEVILDSNFSGSYESLISKIIQEDDDIWKYIALALENR